MKQYAVILSTFFFALSLFSISQQTLHAQGPPKKGQKLIRHSKGENAIPNQFIVVLENEFHTPFIESPAYKRMKSREQKAEALSNYKNQFRQKLLPFLKENRIDEKSLKKVYAGSIVGFVAVLPKTQLTAILNLKVVKWVEQDSRYKLIFTPGKLEKITPQRTDWGVEMVGSGSGLNLENIAFVLDTGIDQDHPDLNVNRSLSTSLIAHEPGKDDKHGHGTHCAGIIGAKDNLVGTKGVAAGATVVGVKVVDQTGLGDWSDLLSGITYTGVVANPGDVVNISMGGPGYQWIITWSIQTFLGNRGVYVTIAAGNENMDASDFSPANTEGNRIFTVSNMMPNKHIAPNSNFGNGPVDYAAPGMFIYSTDKDGGYTTNSGTSMAAPHVAGIILINHGTIRTNGTLLVDKDPIKDKIASVN